jgi:hypothetical protein
MATRIHKIVEIFNKQEGDIFNEYKKAWNMALDSTKQFDFGDDKTLLYSEDGQSIYDYAKDLARHNLLKLPYESTYFTSSRYDDKGRRSDLAFLCAILPNGKYMLVYHVHMSPDYEMIVDFGKMIIHLSEVALRFEEGFSFDYDRITKFKFYERIVKEDVKDYVCNRNAQLLFLMLGLLESPSVEVRTVGSNSSVNKRRAKKGLPPINSIHEVVIKLNGVRYSLGGEREGDNGTKRAHWRRGHIRRLPSGQITNVRPCLVAFTGNENVPEQIYKVTA